jgi:polysaccharide chain length determinant protein (PEP-CTERM system associated)
LPDSLNPIPEDESSFGEIAGQIVRFVVRRRWWILLTTCGTAFAVIAVAQRLPSRYTSVATLLVVQQQVPERYVVPNNTMDIRAALQAMKQEVLSRTQLLKIIKQLDLYPDKTNRMAPEKLVEVMLGDIEIAPLDEAPGRRDFNAFRISFVAGTPILAQSVTSTLTSLFINENLKTREQQATNTTAFLSEQVEAKKRKLDEQEQMLRDFKLAHMGELPEQQQGNLGILAALQTQLQNSMANLSRAQQQRVYLETMIGGYSRGSGLGVPPISPTLGSPNASLGSSPLEIAQNDLARLEAARDSLLLRFTPQHPDVVKAERGIARARDSVKRLVEAVEARPHAVASDSPQSLNRPDLLNNAQEIALAQLNSQLEANHVEMNNILKEEALLKEAIAKYENRINQTPVREQQQAGIARDTLGLREEYVDLQKKLQESQLATNLEKQQGGQQFRLVDPASLPAVPSSPKRLKLSFGGLACGLFLGVAAAFLGEMKARAFYTEKELIAHLAPAAVFSIPLLLTANEERGLFWKHAVEWLAGSALILALLAAEWYVYRSPR